MDPRKRYKKINGKKQRDGYICGNPTGRRGQPWWCVAVKIDENKVQVRDTKDPKDTTLAFTHNEWRAFIEAVKNGEFNVT